MGGRHPIFIALRFIALRPRAFVWSSSEMSPKKAFEGIRREVQFGVSRDIWDNSVISVPMNPGKSYF